MPASHILNQVHLFETRTKNISYSKLMSYITPLQQSLGNSMESQNVGPSRGEYPELYHEVKFKSGCIYKVDEADQLRADFCAAYQHAPTLIYEQSIEIKSTRNSSNVWRSHVNFDHVLTLSAFGVESSSVILCQRYVCTASTNNYFSNSTAETTFNSQDAQYPAQSCSRRFIKCCLMLQ